MKLATTIATIAALCCCSVLTDAYIMHPPAAATRRSTLMMKRGRGSFKKEIEGPAGMGSSRGGAAVGSGRNWITIPKVKPSQLPKTEGKVELIETQAIQLVDGNTNPKGAVSVMKYEDETYCFSVSCPCCKIPLTKAKPSPPSADSNGSPRVSCDLCKSTYSLKTGEQLESAESTGFFGGIAKSVLSANTDSGPLPVYALGEKNGRVLISLEK
eukprot:CAMPEP_0119555720 /NCGR_PEP_ID=MMETSP1352-20130426/7845_1 /TAXON_ID=265584 /ORGANISM="Stauroneis constricta, Strain CCMP1120" /LENGTH=212 /DNA_ID=CAMNT_0007602531 /DNA_START=52 /DNA_END=687 /DNA_ORIENTATION=+